MNLTDKLKSWLTDHKLVDEAASDEECKPAVLKALQDGEMTPQELADMTAAEEPEDELGKIIGDAVSQAVGPLANRLNGMESTAKGAETLARQIDEATAQATPGQPSTASQKATEMFQGAGAGSPRVKLAVEDYSSTKAAAYHSRESKSLPGERAMYGDKPLDEPSKRDLAISAAWFKQMIARTRVELPQYLRMTDHDKDLVQWALRNETFSGPVGRDGAAHGRKLSEFERKTLLDDAAGASGGEAAIPDIFDEAVILTPLLHGEVFPLVTVIPVAAGSTATGFSLGNPTVGHTAEGGAITEFVTTNMIAAYDTNIFPVVGAITLGLDFMSDSPVDIGAMVVRNYGQQMLRWLDNQICNGDGTTEPTGVLLTTGETGTDIGNPAGGDGAVPQIDDYETLLFSVGKEYQPAEDRARCAFIANLTTYRRARAIAVGAGDARRIFGMNHRDYTLLESPFKIQNDIGNQRCGFYNFRRYRMYRRLGMQVRIETAGATLALSNEQLIVVRQRWGGRFEATLAGAYSNNWQA